MNGIITNHNVVGDILIQELHIVRNRKGVFFHSNTKEVISFDELERKIIEIEPCATRSFKKEVISYIDIMCNDCKYSSFYFRKSLTKYGLVNGANSKWN